MLLNRTRPLSLTDPGRTYYEHACRLPGAGAGGSLGARRRRRPARPVAPSAPLAFTPRYLAPLRRASPSAIRNCGWTQADDRFVNLQEPRFDMALRMGRLDDSCLVARPITANRHLLCASPAYLARHGVPQHPEELQAHDGLVYYNREPGGMLCLPVDGEPASFRIRVRMRTDSGHQLLEGARAGSAWRSCRASWPPMPCWPASCCRSCLATRRTAGRFPWSTARPNGRPGRSSSSASSSKRKSAIRHPGTARSSSVACCRRAEFGKPNQRFAFRCLSPRARRA